MRDVELAKAVTGSPGEMAPDVLARVKEARQGHVVILDERRRPVSWLSRRQLPRMDVIPATHDDNLPLVTEGSTLSDALDTMLVSSAGAAPVTGHRHAFEGVITVEVVMDAITHSRKASSNASDNDSPVGTNTGTIEVQGGTT